MSKLIQNAPDRRSARQARRVSKALRVLVRSTRRHRRHRTGLALRRYVNASSRFMGHVARVCGHRGLHADVHANDASEPVWPEQEGSHGVNTFTDYHNASGEGQAIPAGSWVNVSCKVYDPYIASVNPDGYWYRIESSPWSDAYYAPANTFMNGDPWGGPYTHNTDDDVPDCGSVTTPPAAPSVSLAQGPAAPSGYRYAITVSNFAPNSSVTVTCFDSASPSGFYSFSLGTDSSGDGFTESYCFSGDGPDHWVVVNDSVTSNHVSWGSTGGGTTTVAPPTETTTTGTPTTTTGTTTPPPPSSDHCETYQGSWIADSGSVAASLFGHYLEGLGDPVVIDWSYFSGNSEFVAEARSLHIGQEKIGWEATFPSDMYFALGHFTIERDTADCYLVYDHYDFQWRNAKQYLVFFPEWAIQIFGAREFDEHASGKL